MSKFNIFTLFEQEASRFQRLGGFDDESHLIALFTSLRKCFKVVSDSLEHKQEAPFVKVVPLEYNAKYKIKKISKQMSDLNDQMKRLESDKKIQETLMMKEMKESKEMFHQEYIEKKCSFDEINITTMVTEEMKAEIRRDVENREKLYYEERLKVMDEIKQKEVEWLKLRVSESEKLLEEKGVSLKILNEKFEKHETELLKTQLIKLKPFIESKTNALSQELKDSLPFELDDVGKEPTLWFILHKELDRELIEYVSHNRWHRTKEYFVEKRDKKRKEEGRGERTTVTFKVEPNVMKVTAVHTEDLFSVMKRREEAMLEEKKKEASRKAEEERIKSNPRTLEENFEKQRLIQQETQIIVKKPSFILSPREDSSEYDDDYEDTYYSSD